MESVKNNGFTIVLVVSLLLCFFAVTAVLTQGVTSASFPTGLLPNGSFEEDNTIWSENNSDPCDVKYGERFGLDLPSAYDGSQMFTAGGACRQNRTAVSNSVAQNVTVPANASDLSLWYFAVKFREADAGNEDQAYVTVNGETAWQLPLQETNNTKDWTQVIIDVSDYAGQTVTLTLGVSQDDDSDFGLALFDYLTWLQPELTIQMKPNKTIVNNGTAVDFTVSLVNSGNTSLNQLAINNTLATKCDRSADTLPALAPGEQTSYVCSQLITAVQFVNTVTVTAVDPFENRVTASTQSEITGINSAIAINMSPPVQTIPYGKSASFTVMVTNENALALEDVQIVIPNVPNCSRTIDRLSAYSNLFYTCTQLQVVSNMITTATVTGHITGFSDQLQDSMSVRVEVEAPPTEPPTEPPAEPISYTTYLPILSNNYFPQNQWGEPNDICPNAFKLSTTNPRQFLAENVDDWYQFELTETSDVTIRLTGFVPVAGQISIWRGDCDSAVFLAHNGDFSPQKTITLFDQPPGTYLIWLINDGPMNNENPYTLSFDFN